MFHLFSALLRLNSLYFVPFFPLLKTKNIKLWPQRSKPSATHEQYPSVHFRRNKKPPFLQKYINVFKEIQNAYKCLVTVQIIAACQPKAFSNILPT